MRATFLASSAGLRLTKTITPTESRSYPDVKMVSSTQYDVPLNAKWADDFTQLLRDHGAKGHCLLKGPLKQPLVNESRAGVGDKTAYADLLILDLDNLALPAGIIGKPPLTSVDVTRIAEEIISQLGPAFKDVTYIAQASSSLGRKVGRVSMHIYIPLTVPLPPKTVKLWLKHINLTVSLFKDQIELSSTGQALKYPLDPSVADNTKLIFISPPDFTAPGLDPFATANDRIAIVKKTADSVDLAALMGQLNPEKVFSSGNELKDELREKQGLKKRAPRLTTVNVGGENLEVITNPDKMSISVVDDYSLPYVRCNINGGDSGAYYFNVNDPSYMFNFKDEPIFEIAQADKDFHDAIFEKYRNDAGEGATRPLRPVVLRDFATDTIFNGIYDPNASRFTDEFPLTPTSAGAIEGFMRSHGQAKPDYVPEAKVVFDPPNGNKSLNLDSAPFYVNLYRPTPIMDQAEPPKVACKFDDIEGLFKHTPIIATVMKHMCGDGREELRHFLNWLAFIYQFKCKAMTAWVFGGVPGTGKGVFVNRVLRPIFGDQQVTMKSLENIEEQFNNFMRTAMFLVVDEFRMGDAKGGHTGSTRMADKLKHQITEPTVTIRSMRSNQVELPSYTNYIFLTNRNDAVKIEPGDRRYNVAPRQERKLLDVYPDMAAQIEKIDAELPKFAGLLKTFKVNVQAAKTCLSNSAKENMKNVSMSVFDDFCDSFLKGKFAGIVELLDIQLTDTFNAGRITSAQKFVKSWIADAKTGQSSLILPDQLRTIYHVLNDNQQALSPRQFSKMLARNGLDARSCRTPNQKIIRAIPVTWVDSEETIDNYIETFFTQEDLVLLPKTPVQQTA